MRKLTDKFHVDESSSSYFTGNFPISTERVKDLTISHLIDNLWVFYSKTNYSHVIFSFKLNILIYIALSSSSKPDQKSTASCFNKVLLTLTREQRGLAKYQQQLLNSRKFKFHPICIRISLVCYFVHQTNNLHKKISFCMKL